MGGQFLAGAIGIGAGLVDLVDRHHDRNLGGASVVDRLDGLRHDAVVGSHDQHRDVGHLGAAGAHGGERFVARGIQERDLATVWNIDLVGTDVLGDAAGLGRDHRGLADRVKQGGLAVVDVAHDGHDRRSRHQVGGVVVVGDLLVLFVGCMLDRDLTFQLAGEQFDRVIGQRHRQGHHLPQSHHHGDDPGRRDPEGLGQLLDGDTRRNLDRTRGDLDLFLRFRTGAALTSLRRLAAGLGVDHDAALALGRSTALRARMARRLSRLLRGRGARLSLGRWGRCRGGRRFGRRSCRRLLGGRLLLCRWSLGHYLIPSIPVAARSTPSQRSKPP